MNLDGDVTKPVNLGNPSEITIQELASRIIDLTGSRSFIDYRPALQDDPRQRCPNIQRAKDLLDWQPKVGLEEGLKRTIDYFDQLLSRDAPALRQPSRKAVA
jgi:UDP-glucuronate decarboxylase